MNNFKSLFLLSFVLLFVFSFGYNVKAETIIEKSVMMHDSIIDSDYVFLGNIDWIDDSHNITRYNINLTGEYTEFDYFFDYVPEISAYKNILLVGNELELEEGKEYLFVTKAESPEDQHHIMYYQLVDNLTIHDQLLLDGLKSAPRAKANYTDVNYSSYNVLSHALDFVTYWGMFGGYSDGTFRPEDEVNRAELIKIIVEASFSDEEIDSCVEDNVGNSANVFFPDVEISKWYAKYVCVAKLNNIVGGYPDGTFKPTEKVSFVEAAKILSLGFGYELESDVMWYIPYVMKLDSMLAIPSTVERFNSELTRIEVAELIYNLKTFFAYFNDIDSGFYKTYSDDSKFLSLARKSYPNIVKSESIDINGENVTRTFYRDNLVVLNYPENWFCMTCSNMEVNNKIYYKGNYLNGLDFSTFELISDRFYKDKNNVYSVNRGDVNVFNLKRLDNVDLGTFEDLGKYFFKDNNGVYSKFGSDREKLVWEQVLPAPGNVYVEASSFEKLDNTALYIHNHGMYTASAVKVKVLGFESKENFLNALSQIEYEYLEYKEGNYFKDNNDVYYFNGDGFVKIVNLTNSYNYVVDSNWLVSSNAVFYKGEYLEGVKGVSFKAFTNKYFRNNENVYCITNTSGGLEYEVLEGESPLLFEKVGNTFYKGGEGVYSGCDKIEGIDIVTFEVYGNSIYYKDKDNVYVKQYVNGEYSLDVLLEADLETFEVIEQYCAKDKDYYYNNLDVLNDLNGAECRSIAVE